MIPTSTDEARLRSAFDQHFGALTRYCLRRLPRQEVEDAVSRIFSVAWRKIEQLPDSEEALPWLYRVASYEVATMRRSLRRQTSLRTRLNGLASAQSYSPDVAIVQKAEHQEIVDALAALSPSDREIIMLRSYEELSTDEIAQVLDCSPEAARQRLSRALKRLRKEAGIAKPRQEGAQS